jgi:hypothetical protein
MDYEVLSFQPDALDRIVKQGLIRPIGENFLFDILADRAREYRLNIPKSKFHEYSIKMMTFGQYMCEVRGLEVEGDPNDIRETWHSRVLVLEYDQTACKNPKYVRSYLLKQIAN